ncbi:MAG: glycosyltransferase [Chitinophagaceae bacterium]|jgi:glycosyltransferase involved in cell wall biosynthesis|nr:glycosyltransferase [Chitinophagaceae bacterium]
MNLGEQAPLVSVIIPVFNAEKFVIETIQSVLNQTYTNIEIVLVDDGSTDNSLNIIKTFESEKIKIISIKNGGAARARNIGFRFSTGSYIQYLDADDLLHKDKIRIQINEALSYGNKFDFIFSSNWLRFKDEVTNEIGGFGPGESLEKNFQPLDWLILRPMNLMTIHAWLTPRELIEKTTGWLESMTLDDDGEFFTRVIANASQIVFCKNALVYYRTDSRENTLSSQKSIKAFESAFQSLQTYISVMSSFNEINENAIKEAIGNNVIYYAYQVYPISKKLFLKALNIKFVKFASVNFNQLKKKEYSKKYHLIPWKLLSCLKQVKKGTILMRNTNYILSDFFKIFKL